MSRSPERSEGDEAISNTGAKETMRLPRLRLAMTKVKRFAMTEALARNDATFSLKR